MFLSNRINAASVSAILLVLYHVLLCVSLISCYLDLSGRHLDFDAIKFQVRKDKLFDNNNYLFGAISNNDDSRFHLFTTDESRCVTTLPGPVNDFSLSIAGTIGKEVAV